MYGEDHSNFDQAIQEQGSASTHTPPESKAKASIYSLSAGPFGPFSHVASFLTLEDSVNFLSTSKMSDHHFKENLHRQIKTQSKDLLLTYKFKSIEEFRGFLGTLGSTQGLNSGEIKLEFAPKCIPSLRDWRRFFAQMQSLSSLDLSENRLGEAGLKALFQSIPYSGITALDLSHNQVNSNAAKALAYNLPQWPVTRLKLNSNEMGDEGIKAIAKALPESQIETLELEQIQIQIEAMTDLAEALTHSSIKELSLFGTALYGTDLLDNKPIITLSEALPQTQITSLNLGHTNFNRLGAQALARALPQSPVTRLNLRASVFETNEIIEALPNTKLTYLDLSETQLEDEGAEAISIVLPQTRITELILDQNDITSTGIESIARVLSRTLVKDLDLSGNPFGDEGAQIVIGALPESHIRELNLGAAEITNQGALTIATQLSHLNFDHLRRLTHLDLSDNLIETTGAEAIRDLFIHLNHTHIELNLSESESGNEIE